MQVEEQVIYPVKCADKKPNLNEVCKSIKKKNTLHQSKKWTQSMFGTVKIINGTACWCKM